MVGDGDQRVVHHPRQTCRRLEADRRRAGLPPVPPTTGWTNQSGSAVTTVRIASNDYSVDPTWIGRMAMHVDLMEWS